MTGRKLPRVSRRVTRAVAAVVIVIVVCGTALAIVGLRLSLYGRTSGGPPQAGLTAALLRSGDFLSTNAGITFVCGPAVGSFLTFVNVGTVTLSVTAATITWAGQTNTYSLAAGSRCPLGAAGSSTPSQNILFATTTKLLTNAAAGGTYTGSVTLSSGLVLVFTGTFE